MAVSFTKDESDRLDRHQNETQVSQPMVYILMPIIYQNDADGKCVYLQMVCSV